MKSWNNTIVRLTKDENRARKVKTFKILEDEIQKIYIQPDIQFKLVRDILADSNDLINIRRIILEEIYETQKVQYRELSEKINDMKNDMDTYDYEKWENVRKSIKNIRLLAISLPKQHQRILELKKENISSEIKKVNIKIIDASHNFRYSKLKKLIQENDK